MAGQVLSAGEIFASDRMQVVKELPLSEPVALLLQTPGLYGRTASTRIAKRRPSRAFSRSRQTTNFCGPLEPSWRGGAIRLPALI